MLEILREDIINGSATHAYLIYGSGAEDEAYAFAAALNCRNPQNGEACGSCRRCLQMKADNLNGFCVLEPAGKTGYKVEQIRELLKKTVLTAPDNVIRVILFRQADMLNDESYNAMLKTLEEPPEHTVFLLTAKNRDSIASTVVSRCRVVHAENSRENVSVSLEAAASVLRMAKNGNTEEIFAFGEHFEKENNREGLISFFQSAGEVLGKNYLYRAGGPCPAFPLEDGWSAEELFAAWQWALTAPALIGGNINVRLILENFLLYIKRNGGTYGNCSWCTL